MDDDTARAPAINKRRQRRGFRASLALVGLLVTIGLLAAACGGGSKDPGAASGSGDRPRPSRRAGTSGASGSSGERHDPVGAAAARAVHALPRGAQLPGPQRRRRATSMRWSPPQASTPSRPPYQAALAGV